VQVAVGWPCPLPLKNFQGLGVGVRGGHLGATYGFQGDFLPRFQALQVGPRKEFANLTGGPPIDHGTQSLRDGKDAALYCRGWVRGPLHLRTRPCDA
jgi:hypothetical protein